MDAETFNFVAQKGMGLGVSKATVVRDILTSEFEHSGEAPVVRPEAWLQSKAISRDIEGYGVHRSDQSRWSQFEPGPAGYQKKPGSLKISILTSTGSL